MLEPEFTGEAVGTAEGLAGERGQMVDVQGIARTEEGLEQWISEDAGVEDVLQVVQRLVAARMLVEGGHTRTLPMRKGPSGQPSEPRMTAGEWRKNCSTSCS
jgi:hypothetical protein